MPNQKKFKIKIFDKDYTLLVDNDDRAKKVGEYVTYMMNELKGDFSEQTPQTVAVLVSLNIANEMFAEREELMNLFKELNDKVDNLNQKIDGILKK